jgi:hypothetical protein
MQSVDLAQMLSFGAVSDMSETAQALLREDPRFDGDIFLKKAEAWAYQAYFLSTLNEVEDAQGRFSVVPVDALVMNHLESGVAPSNRLPTGHLYEPAMHRAKAALTLLLETPISEAAANTVAILDRDLVLRDYLLQRRLEHFFS